MPLRAGETFAGYRIVRLLGSGGMGEVYLAEHPRLPRRNALKELPADVSADPDYRARFNREADLASKLWYPHIIRVHDEVSATVCFAGCRTEVGLVVIGERTQRAHAAIRN